jgi:1,4-dihydroxy-2-naphthoyl-CoA hydrolase
MFTYDRYVHFRETDAAGVIYFSEVLNLCHEAYEASLRHSGIDLKTFFSPQGSVILPIVHAEVDYFAPLYCGDKLRIEMEQDTSGQRITQPTTEQITQSTEFTLSYQLYVPQHQRPAARAKTRHVCLDSQTRQRYPLPPTMATWLSEL